MRITPAVKIILIVNIVFFALSELICPMFPLGGYTDWFTAFNALHPIGSSNVVADDIWQLCRDAGGHKEICILLFNMWNRQCAGQSIHVLPWPHPPKHPRGSIWRHLRSHGSGSLLFPKCQTLHNPHPLLLQAYGARRDLHRL